MTIQFYAIRNDLGRWFGGIALVQGQDYPLFEYEIVRALPFPSEASAGRAIQRYGLGNVVIVPVDVDQLGRNRKTRVIRETTRV